MSEKLNPESDHNPSLAQRFTTFVDQYVNDTEPDLFGCRTKLLVLRNGIQGDRLIVARHEIVPDTPSWYLTRTVADVMHVNIMTFIYEAGVFSIVTTVNTPPNNNNFIIDTVLLSYETAAANGLIMPIDTSMM